MGACNHEGCTRAVKARGMCNPHYVEWCAANRDNILGAASVNKIEELLPGKQSQLMERSGYTSGAVKRALAILRAEERAHIGEYDPPNKSGMTWQPVYAAGPGEDAKLTKAMRRQQSKATIVKCIARRALKGKTAAIPRASRWAAALLMGL